MRNKTTLAVKVYIDKTCISIKRPEHFWLACYSICLGPRTEKLLMVPQVASQHKTAAHQRGQQQVCTTCQLCPSPANMKRSCMCRSWSRFVMQSPQCIEKKFPLCQPHRWALLARTLLVAYRSISFDMDCKWALQSAAGDGDVLWVWQW